MTQPSLSRPLVFGSVCSGIECASVAWMPLGWRCAWTAEIEPFPSAVIQERWGHKNYGDFTKIGGDAEPIDLLAGGTPCQDFSVAGLRAGMAGERGNLTLEFLRLADRLKPRWIVWENVPGVLSSNGGKDFGSFLGGLGQLGYGFAYRILDAQYAGVPQRRRRVFVVGHLGDWRRAAAVLFERESLQGHPPPSRAEGQRVAATVAGGSGERGHDDPVNGTLVAKTLCGYHPRNDSETENFIAHSLRADGFDASEDGSGRGTPIISIQGAGMRSMGPNMNGCGISETGVMYTLNASEEHAIAAPLMSGSGHRAGHGARSGHCKDSHIIAAFSGGQGVGSGTIGYAEEKSPTLKGNGGGNAVPQMQSGMAVRRLTPRECERLQGLPDVLNRLVVKCADERQDYVKYAGPLSVAQSHAENELAAVRVRIDLEGRLLQLLSRGRCLWSVSTAATQNMSPHPVRVEDFVRAVVPTITTLAKITRTGEAVSPPNTPHSLPLLRGSALVTVSGRGIDELAGDAEKLTRAASDCTKFTTSEAGHDSPAYASHLRTLSCFVIAAISSFIPSRTARASSFVIETVEGYSAITYRGKKAADGPRYKAIGNGWAIPDVRWIGERIQMVNAL